MKLNFTQRVLLKVVFFLFSPTLLLSAEKPNIILILADDLGYGDLGAYGSSMPTPNIDKLAEHGMRFTNFRSAPMCSPARAALLTGRYANRVGIPGVIFSSEDTGLSGEITIADTLRFYGYNTMAVGKWHLGHKQAVYMPGWHGFNGFRGIPYSNDMSPLPDIDGEVVVGDLTEKREELTLRFMNSATDFINKAERDKPYFLYLSFTAPHRPLVPSLPFKGVSGRGSYSDTLLELDYAVGEVLEASKKRDLEFGTQTLVIFASDNGALVDPSLPAGESGSNFPLSGGKFDTREGGIRVPLIMSMPGVIPQGVVSGEHLSSMDLKPTLGFVVGSDTWHIGETDGENIWPFLIGEVKHVERRAPVLHFRFGFLDCATFRLLGDDWVQHIFKIQFVGDEATASQPTLYDLEADPGEKTNIASLHPRVVAQITSEVRKVLVTFPPGSVRSNLF